MCKSISRRLSSLQVAKIEVPSFTNQHMIMSNNYFLLLAGALMLFAAHEICAREIVYLHFKPEIVEAPIAKAVPDKMVFLMAPEYIGMHSDYTVHILLSGHKMPSKLDFELECRVDTAKVVAKNSTLVDPDEDQTQVKLHIGGAFLAITRMAPQLGSQPECALIVRAQALDGSWKLNDGFPLIYLKEGSVCLVDSDKAIYKSGQRFQLRLLEILRFPGAKTNSVGVMKQLENPEGFVGLDWNGMKESSAVTVIDKQLSQDYSQPIGNWTMKVDVDDRKIERKFGIEELINCAAN